MPINSDKPKKWKSDTLESIDYYNDWFIRFAPITYREQRKLKTEEVSKALNITNNLRNLSAKLLIDNPGILPMLRMTAAPPLARDRLIGLSYVSKNLVLAMEGSDSTNPRTPPRMNEEDLKTNIERIIDVLNEVADRDLFPWLDDDQIFPTSEDVQRSASVVADRLCGASADPIIRNAQERRQLSNLANFLISLGYREIYPYDYRDIMTFPGGTFSFRYNLEVGPENNSIKIPIDCIISKFSRQPDELPILIEAKSAGDATNTNKRRKEEAQKFNQLKQRFGDNTIFLLFLCGYFEPGYLGYEASEGIDWIWEHRITDLLFYLDDFSKVTELNQVNEPEPNYSKDFLILESERLIRQKNVDSWKSQLERNILGQFSTPFTLAEQILVYALKQVQEQEKLNFLEPACGSGVFISSLIRKSLQNYSLTCVEIDNAYANICEEVFSDYEIDFFKGDYFDFLKHNKNVGKYNCLVTNPPYIRHHHIESDTKRNLQTLVYQLLNIQVSGLSGLYVYYILLAHITLNEGAIASWLIPSEFLFTNYGRALREYLLEYVSLIRIHRFNADDVQFEDALVSSCVITYCKRKPKDTHGFTFTFGSYNNPDFHREILISEINASEKWLLFELNNRNDKDGYRLEDLFYITRGLATGNNDFFIVDENKILQEQLESNFLIPIIPSPRELKSSIIESDEQGLPNLKNRKYLISVDKKFDEIKDKYPFISKYLNDGITDGVNSGYLCKSRKVWYYQERRDPPLFIATYMGRGVSNSCGPIRFILNRSKAVATNSYICLYPKPFLEKLLKSDYNRVLELLDLLNSINKKEIENAGRSYGGGLQKIEPRELRSIYIEQIPKWLVCENIMQLELF